MEEGTIDTSNIILSNISKSYTIQGHSSTNRILDAQKTSLPLEGLTAIVGWSGSGKTTLVNLLSLSDYPDIPQKHYNDIEERPCIRYSIKEQQYTIEYTSTEPIASVRHGNATYAHSVTIDEIRQKLFGCIFQRHLLHPNLTVGSNLQVPFLAASRYLPEKVITDFSRLLEIDELLDKYPDQYSGQKSGGLLRNSSIVTKSLIKG